MISHEDFQTELRRKAGEILSRLSPSEREALLVKCWMSHDARWFMAVAGECGMEVTNRLNRIAAHEVGKVEAQRIVRALRLPPAVNLDDYLLAQEVFIGLLGPDLLDYRVNKAGDDAYQVHVHRCFAHDNAAHAGGLVIGLLSGFVGTASAIERQGKGASLASQVIVIAAVVAIAVLAKVRTENNPKAKTAETLQQAEAAYRAHDLPKVEALTTQVLAESKDPLASLLRAVARNERGDLDGGFADVNDAIVELRDTDRSPMLLAEAFALRAGVHQVAERFGPAEADLSLAYKLRPDPAYLGLRAYSRFRIGDLDGGMQDAQATLANAASSAMVLNNLAWGVLVTEQDLSFALKLADASIDKEPSAAAKSTRCWIRAARGEPELALPDCVAAVESGNELMDLGMVAFLQQHPEEALVRWEEAATKSAVDARDLAPWIARARAQLSGDDAGVP